MDTTWQFICILVFTITGMAVALIHDVYRALIKTLRLKGFMYIVSEMIFAFIIFTAVSAVLVWMTEGAIRPVYLVSVLIGIILYYCICGLRVRDVIKRMLSVLQRVIARFVRFIVMVCYTIGKAIMFPIEGIFRISTCITRGFNGIMKTKR